MIEREALNILDGSISLGFICLIHKIFTLFAVSKWDKIPLIKPQVDEEAVVTREKPEVKRKPTRRSTFPPLMQPMDGGSVGELGKYNTDKCGNV